LFTITGAGPDGRQVMPVEAASRRWASARGS